MSHESKPMASHFILVALVLPAEIAVLCGIFIFGLFNVLFQAIAYPFATMQGVCAHALRAMTDWRKAVMGVD